MALVFDTPRYKNQALDKLLSFRALMHKDDPLYPAAEEALLRLPLSTLTDDPSIESTYAYLQIVRTSPLVAEALSHLADAMFDKMHGDGYQVYNDDIAIAALLHDHLSDSIRPAVSTFYYDAEHASSDTFATGAMAGLISPGHAFISSQNLRPFKSLYVFEPKLYAMFEISESWVKSAYSRAAAKYVSEFKATFMTAHPAAETIVLKNTPLTKAYPTLRFYMFADLLLVVNKRKKTSYLLDSTARNELSLLLRKPASWWIYAKFWRGEERPYSHEAVLAASRGIEYVNMALESIVADGAFSTDYASAMKLSYTMRLANASGDSDLASSQISILAESMPALSIPTWYNTLAAWSSEIAVDFGTIWNMMPAQDADLEVFDAALKEKLNAPRTWDDDAWEDFTSYARGVISAHICFNTRSCDYEWTVESIPAWAISCAEGTMHYPPPENEAYVIHALKWTKMLEEWYWAADDVTHVYADLDKYSSATAAAKLDSSDTNELLYALKSAPYLSDNWMPEAVRATWESGRIAWDNVLCVAVKRENTKGGKKVRDTHSACDILREILSEVDHNMAELASMVDGCAMRKGRAATERRIESIFSGARADDLFISVDVEGWSPNAPRKKHLEFIDMLLSFFEGTRKVSTVFKDTIVVNARRGFYSKWEATDGSVQGFFGTSDTILHSLMIQWAFVKTREEKTDKIAKMCLIDDAIARLGGYASRKEEALNLMATQYAKLGYKLDVNKTIASTRSAHFLNRLYVDGKEVISACKVFAKAFKSLDIKYPTLWQDIDSIFNAYAGAADRGASAMLCYRMAISCATKELIAATGYNAFSTVAFQMIGAFLPRSMGGIGLPSFTTWITHTAEQEMDNGIQVIGYMYSLMTTYNLKPKFKSNYLKVISALLNVELVARPALSAIENPFEIKTKFQVDQTSVLRTAINSISHKMISARPFAALLSTVISPKYSEYLHALASSANWPAPVIMAWSDSLPHAILQKTLAKVEHSEIMVRFMSYKTRKRVVNEMRIARKRAALAWRSYDGRNFEECTALVIGSAWLEDKRMDQGRLDGITLSANTLVSALEAITHCPKGTPSAIKSYINMQNRDQLYTGCPGSSICRSTRSKPVVKIGKAIGKSSNPVIKTLNTLLQAMVGAASAKYDPEPLVMAYVKVWTGSAVAECSVDVIPSNLTMKALTSRNRTITHTIMAFPNAGRSAPVDANVAMHAYETVPKAFDWLSIIYSIQAIRLGCIEFGDLRTIAIEYTFKAGSTIFQRPSTVRQNPFEATYDQSPMLGSADANLHEELLAQMLIYVNDRSPGISASLNVMNEIEYADMSPLEALEKVGGLNPAMMSLLHPSPIMGAASIPVEHEVVADVDFKSPLPSASRVISKLSHSAEEHKVSLALMSLYYSHLQIAATSPEDPFSKEICMRELKTFKRRLTYERKRGVARSSLTLVDALTVINSWGEQMLASQISIWFERAEASCYKKVVEHVTRICTSGEGDTASRIRVNSAIYYQTAADNHMANTVRDSIKRRFLQLWAGALTKGSSLAEIRDLTYRTIHVIEEENKAPFPFTNAIQLKPEVLTSIEEFNQIKKRTLNKVGNAEWAVATAACIKWAIVDIFSPAFNDAKKRKAALVAYEQSRKAVSEAQSMADLQQMLKPEIAQQRTFEGEDALADMFQGGFADMFATAFTDAAGAEEILTLEYEPAPETDIE